MRERDDPDRGGERARRARIAAATPGSSARTSCAGPSRDAGSGGPALVLVVDGRGAAGGGHLGGARPAGAAWCAARRRAAPASCCAVVETRLDAALERRRALAPRPRRLPGRARRERRPAWPVRRSLRRRGGGADDVGGHERRPRRDRGAGARRGSGRAWWSRATTAPRATSRGCRARRGAAPAAASRWSTAWARTGSRPICWRTARPAASSTRPTTTRARRAGPAGRALPRRLHVPRRLRAGAGPPGRRGAGHRRATRPSARAAANARRNGLTNMRCGGPTPSICCARSRRRAALRRGGAGPARVRQARRRRGALADRRPRLQGGDPARRAADERRVDWSCACSCSGRVTRAHLDEICADAAADAGRGAQICPRRRRPRPPRTGRRARDRPPQGLDLRVL